MKQGTGSFPHQADMQHKSDKYGSTIKRARVVYVFIVRFMAFAASGVSLILAETIRVKETTFHLSDAEEEYVATLQDRSLSIALTEDMAYQIDKDGTEFGTAVPLLNFLRYELGLELNIIDGKWAEAYSGLKTGDVDIMFGLPVTEAEQEGEKKIIFAEPICENILSMAVNKKSSRAFKGDFDGIVLGMMPFSAQAYYMAPYLNSAHEVRFYDSSEEMVSALSKGEVDAAILTDDMGFLAHRHGEVQLETTFPQMIYEETIGTTNEELRELIDIFNRFMLWTEEGDSMKEEMKEQKLRYYISGFAAEEGDVLTKIRSDYDEIGFCILQQDDIPMSYSDADGLTGIYPDMLAFFKEITGLEFKLETAMSDADAMSALEENRIQVIAGLIENSENMEVYDFSEGIYENMLQLAALSSSERITLEDIPYCYFGAGSATMPLLKNSVLEEHTVEYQTTRELLEALETGAISGAIIKKSEMDFYNLAGAGDKYMDQAGVNILFTERLAYCKANTQLNSMLNELVHIYKITHPGYEDIWGEAKMSYQDSMLKYYQNEIELKERTIIIGAATIIFLVLAMVSIVLAMRYFKRMNMKLQALCNYNNSMDLLEIDMKGKWIKSTDGFMKFGIQDKGKNQLSFDELFKATGFDFHAHYQTLVDAGREDFEIEYGLRNQGRKLFLKEIGICTKSYIVSMLIDLTEIEEETEKLKEKAEIDSLTGLYNRNGYFGRIEGIIERNPEELAIFAFVDINKFKSINDTYGHGIGDEILISFAYSLRKLAHDKNSIVFRIAGDEFGAFRGGITSEGELMDFIGELQSLTMGTSVEGEYVTTSYSCGVAVLHQDAEKLEDLIECADKAMYTAKQNNLPLVSYKTSLEMASADSNQVEVKE